MSPKTKDGNWRLPFAALGVMCSALFVGLFDADADPLTADGLLGFAAVVFLCVVAWTFIGWLTIGRVLDALADTGDEQNERQAKQHANHGNGGQN